MLVQDAKTLIEKMPKLTKEIEIKKGVKVLVSEVDTSVFFDLWDDKEFRDKDDPGVISLFKLAPKLVVNSVVNEAGETYLTLDDYSKLSRVAQAKLNTAALEVNNLGTQEDEEGKNSNAGREENSSSGSLSS